MEEHGEPNVKGVIVKESKNYAKGDGTEGELLQGRFFGGERGKRGEKEEEITAEEIWEH